MAPIFAGRHRRDEIAGLDGQRQRLVFAPHRAVVVEAGDMSRTKTMRGRRPAPERDLAAQIDGLRRDDEFDRGEPRQAPRDRMRLLDDARRHRRIILDAVGDRQRHRAERQGKMADLGLQRRAVFCEVAKPECEPPCRVRKRGRSLIPATSA
jgi:hypothetical protein